MQNVLNPLQFETSVYINVKHIDRYKFLVSLWQENLDLGKPVFKGLPYQRSNLLVIRSGIISI